MKKIILIALAFTITVISCGQAVLTRDLRIQKAAPGLYLNGTGAFINFYNSDVILTQSGNTLTMSGGNFSLTGGYSLLMTGSLGSTGSRLTKVWTGALESTVMPSVNGTPLTSTFAATVHNQSQSTIIGLPDSLLARYTKVQSNARYIKLSDSTGVLTGSYATGKALKDSLALKAYLASPVFTGVPKITASDTIATRAYARTYGGTGTVTIGDVRSEVEDSLNALRPLVVHVADTVSMLSKYSRKASPLFTGLVKLNTDTLATQAYSRAHGSSMSYPGVGIPLSTGSAWGTSITNNSSNWNTAYGWGNHASAGYYVGSSSTIRGLLSSTATGLTYTNSTGVFSLASGYAIPATGDISNWNTAYGWGNHALAGYATVAQLNDTVSLGEVALLKHMLFNDQTGTSYTLVLTDDAKTVTMTNSSANTLTVPLNSSVAFPVGTQITIVQNGTGQTTIAYTSGVTIRSAGSALKLRVQYSSCTLIKTASDTWLMLGDITN